MQLATAVRQVAVFSLMSTIRGWPSASKCVSELNVFSRAMGFDVKLRTSVPLFTELSVQE